VRPVEPFFFFFFLFFSLSRQRPELARRDDAARSSSSLTLEREQARLPLTARRRRILAGTITERTSDRSAESTC